MTSISVTTSLEADASIQATEALQWVFCIQYLVRFQEGQPIRAFIDSNSEVNAMTPAYTAKLDLTIWKTSVGAQKIDGSPLETHDMTLIRFSFQKSQKRLWYFDETFRMSNTTLEEVLGMFFLAFSNVNFQFGTEKLT